MATPIDYTRGISCGACKGKHDTVAQVHLCSRRTRARRDADKVVAAKPVVHPKPILATQAELDAIDAAMHQMVAEEEARQERAVYQHMVDTDTV